MEQPQTWGKTQKILRNQRRPHQHFCPLVAGLLTVALKSWMFLCASAGAEVVFGVHQGTFGFGFELSKRHRCL